MLTFNFIRYTVAACVTTTIGLCCAAPAQSQTLDISPVLQDRRLGDHVIAQILRHGVNGHDDQSSPIHHLGSSLFGLAMIPTNEIGDLEIVSIHRCSYDLESCGPRFKIVVMNKSPRRVDGVDVSVVALLGSIHPHSPHTTVRTCAIEPTSAVEVEVTLPIEALSMASDRGVVIGFQKLVIAIDSHDEWIELCEANNVRAFPASGIDVLLDDAASDDAAVLRPELAPSLPAQDEPLPSAIQPPGAPEPTGHIDAAELRTAIEKMDVQSIDFAAASP